MVILDFKQRTKIKNKYILASTICQTELKIIGISISTKIQYCAFLERCEARDFCQPRTGFFVEMHCECVGITGQCG